MAEESQRLGIIAGRARRVPLNVRGVRPSGKQAGGQVGFPEAAGHAQARLDQRQRGTELSMAHQDPGPDVQQVGDQVVVPGGAGNGQRLFAVAPGDRVAARLVEEVGRGGQRPGARQRRLLDGRRVQERPQRAGSFGGVPAGPPEPAQRGGQPQARFPVGLGQAVGDRGPQIAQLGIEPVQPRGLIGGHQLRGGRLGQGQVVIAMGDPGTAGAAGPCVQLPGCVLPDGFQQPVPSCHIYRGRMPGVAAVVTTPMVLRAGRSPASRASRQAARSDGAVNILRMQSSQTWQAETPGTWNSQHFIPCQDDRPARGAVTGFSRRDRASGASCSARQASYRSPGTPGRRRGEVIAHRFRAGTRR